MSDVSEYIVYENCPPRRIHNLLSPKWTSMVIYALGMKSFRTNELMRVMPGISKKMLNQTLKELQVAGLVSRKVHQVIPPVVEYSLTELGNDFLKPLMELYKWASTHAELLDKVDANFKLAQVEQAV
ncbi:helix-turn-helix transcriptional regulator [Pseudomonas sp. BN605]|uniref:HxlR family transcriptional regulator n=1 Tax=Pseudomonas hunanensis TaxID=1247546 RepID=A0ABD6MVT9_9PSED|nr:MULTISPECIES: helix-turn-helix domain-containing protein [Pseudomonas]MDH4847998.1 helix-turn-helix transcriptional regulator [Pseudomonas sp. BN605]NWL45572.1 HxlR family transcriptional regulator [Pseudomonas hunanensis]